jgi:hypothetical protein
MGLHGRHRDTASGRPTADCLTVGPLIGGCATDLQRVSPGIGRTRASVPFGDPQIKGGLSLYQVLYRLQALLAAWTGTPREIPLN